jgi:hypothetical protein
LAERLTPFIEQIKRWEFDDEVKYIVWAVRREIEGAIVASLALRCAAGERLGPELLLWASRCCSYHKPREGDLEPADPERPVAWVEACVPLICRANPAMADWKGPDRLEQHVRSDLCPALQHVRHHDLDEFLRGANPADVSGLRGLLLHRRLMDVRDLWALYSPARARFASTDTHPACYRPSA